MTANFWWVHQRNENKRSPTLSHGRRHSQSTCGFSAAHILLDGREWRSTNSRFWRPHASFPARPWLHFNTAFRKYAAASGLADWSRMNLDLYNFHTRLAPQSQSSAISSPFLQAACNPTFADHGMTASVAGSLVNVGTATAVIDVNGTTLTSTAPFVLPNRMNSAPEQLLHLGTNASGVEAVSRSPKAP